MFRLIVLCSMLLGADGNAGSESPKDKAAYNSAAARVGKDPAAHIRLALWCEAHGLNAERVRHLALAMAYDPKNVLARGLAGVVSYKGTWKTAEDVQQATKRDPTRGKTIREYLERRARTPHTGDAQLKLAAWCSEHGLTEQALAHYTEVTRIDPSRETAWKHLGYTKNKKANRWLKPEDAAAAKVEAEHQKHADLKWKPRLETLRAGLESASSIQRDKARAGLAQVSDPRALPMVIKVFGTGSESVQLAALHVLSQIDEPSASIWLAAFAIDSPFAQVRERASDILSRRDPRDVIAWLIYRVRKPYKYEIRPARGPGSTASLIVDGEQFDIRRLYRMPAMDVRLGPPMRFAFWFPYFAYRDGNFVMSNPGGFQVTAELGAFTQATREAMLAQAALVTRQRSIATQESLDDDIRLLDALNTQIAETNDRAVPLLQTLTGQSFGASSQAWQSWWANELGMALDSSSSGTKPTFTLEVALGDVPVNLPAAPTPHYSCFAAGTMVHSIDGLKPIEALQVGDLVLSQNTTTGELAFEPVTAVHRNKPNATLRIASDSGESIVATGIHRFWKVGTGWTMARELKNGDRLRRVGGLVEIRSIEADRTQPVYNLDVAQNRNFCVGKAGLLVHDFTFVQPVLVPFDFLPEPGALAGRSESSPR